MANLVLKNKLPVPEYHSIKSLNGCLQAHTDDFLSSNQYAKMKAWQLVLDVSSSAGI